MQANIFDKASRQWVMINSEGDVVLTSDRSKACVIEPDQLQAYIRNYELEYLENDLVAQPVERSENGAASASA